MMMGVESQLETWSPESIKRATLVEVEGVSLTNDLAENWDSLWAFKARPDDLLISTYPKAGTTWIQEIVDMIQHGGDSQKCARAPIYHRIPFIDLFPPPPIPRGLDEAKVMPSPRTIKTHLPVQLVPPSFWEQNCKNGVQNFLEGIKLGGNRRQEELCRAELTIRMKVLVFTLMVAWGSWLDHVCGWWEAKDRRPILYLFYEDMKEDPSREIRKVAQFLGIQLPDPVLKQIVQHTAFESMKANPMANYSTLPAFIMDQGVSPFMRKGMVGDWKEHFTVAQSEQMDDIFAQKLQSSGLTFRSQLGIQH
ncbi:hypothetical protein JD844_001631 [Phrynosoma platyrhinos]|uniref:Sulfotransferase n=1 Tax=Phrynosoma platyrhinos TaxID=52577 RepID=A0ABQ7TAM8_PHRPL|nr:hypothetical protein JD844_001631 [Phrynosoma platyrhinos]